MSIAVACNCGKQLNVKDEFAGRNVRCPACKAIVSTPATPADKPAPRASAPKPAPGADTLALPRRQIVLRSIVLVIALAGAGIAGAVGFRMYANAHDPEQQAITEKNRADIKALEKVDPSNTKLQDARNEVDRFERQGRVCYALLAAAVLGLAGAVLAFMRRRMIAAPLLLLPAVGSGVIAVPAFVLTAPLILSGMFSLMIKPART
jgi:hypothetical protein